MTTNLTQNRSPDAGDANHLSRVSAVWWLAATLIAGATTVINFWRVKDINPVILQDEWVYSMTSRKTDSWDQAPLLDFGNYLFNIVYSWTSICGPGFYTCAKALNHVFLFGFALALFYVVSVLSRPGFGLSVVPLVTLGPVAIYGSLFLPESLFFFLVATTLVFLVRFFSSLERSDLLVAGFLGALASLTKPHGLISVGLFSLAVFLVVTNRSSLFRGSISAVIFGGTAVAGKSLLGFFIAGPKGLNPLAGYRIGNSGFLTGDDLQNRAPGLIERFPGIAAELPNQLTIQFTSLLVLLSAAFAVTALGAFGFGMKNQVLERSFATLTLIWSTGLVLVFSIFGAYLTAGGQIIRQEH